MSAIIGIAALGSFTFHYVSINTPTQRISIPVRPCFTFHYVSINTSIRPAWLPVTFVFTFHYVSINTKISRILEKFLRYLYIPLCFY